MRQLICNALLLLILASASSCVSKSKLDMRRIAFGTMATASKAVINNTSDLQSAEEGIGVYSLMHYDGKDFYVYKNSHLTYSSSDGYWYTGEEKYWIDNATYDFTLIYPYSESSTLGSGAATHETEDNSFTLNCALDMSAPDLMVGSASRDLIADPGNYAPVPVTLEHMFACLEFRVINASETPISRAGQPRLEGILRTGVAHIATDGSLSWTMDYADKAHDEYANNNELTELAAFSDTPHNIYGDGVQLLVLPQQTYKPKDGDGTPYDIKFSFNYTAAGSSEATNCEYIVSNINSVQKWESSKKYVYTAEITPGYIVFSVKVNDWKDDGIFILK